MRNEIKKAPFIKGLDGYRLLAVVGIILYHLFPAALPGGYLGVALFFVLSGYILTDHFLFEYQKTEGFNIFKYLKKRISSLYPVLLMMFLFTLSYMTLFDRNLLVNSKEAVLSTLTLTNNWWQIAAGSSYFDRYANPSPYTHLWFIGVIGQLYLLLPILIVIIEMTFKSKKQKISFIGALALVSALLFAFFFKPENANRAYYGTDTRAFSFLLGMALAYDFPSFKKRKKLGKKERQFLNVLGVGSGLLLGSMYFLFTDHSLFVYRGGMFLYSLLAMLFLAAVVHPGNTFTKIFDGKVVKWLGSRSYGIYLFQYPIMIFYEEKFKVGNHPFLHGLMEILLIFLVTELAYGSLKFIKKLPKKSLKNKKNLVFASVFLLFSGASVYGLITSPEKTLKENQGDLEAVIKKNEALLKDQKKQHLEKTTMTTSSITNEKSSNATETTTTVEPEKPVITEEMKALATKYHLTPEEVLKAQSISFTAVGDSVLLSAAENITELFPKANVDGKVGRQAYNSLPTFNQLDSQGLLKDIVVVHLGTNGAFTKSQFDEVMKKLGKRKVYWINTSASTVRWQNQVNSDLNSFKGDYPNLTLVNWYGVSNGKTDWFYDDQVHPNPTGGTYYVQTLAKALLNEK